MMELVDIRDRLDSVEVRELVDQLEYPPDIRAAKTEQILQEYRDCPDQPFLGMEMNGELVGFIGFRLKPPDGVVIRHITVRRNHRRRGIARQMIFQACMENHFKEISAETDLDAVAFYRRIGFTVESLGEKYPGVERFSCKLELPTSAPLEETKSRRALQP